jgi:ankyrin repeat protein
MTIFNNHIPLDVIHLIHKYLCPLLDDEKISLKDQERESENKIVPNYLIEKNLRPIARLSQTDKFFHASLNGPILKFHELHKNNFKKYQTIKEKQEKEISPHVNLLRAAILQKNIHDVKQLLLGSADVNAKDSRLGTPLHYAAKHAGKEMIALLLRHPEINKQIRNNSGQLPIDCVQDPDATFKKSQLG